MGFEQAVEDFLKKRGEPTAAGVIASGATISGVPLNEGGINEAWRAIMGVGRPGTSATLLDAIKLLPKFTVNGSFVWFKGDDSSREDIWRSKLKFAALLLREELLKLGGGPEPCGALLKLATRETPDLLDKIEAVSPSFLRDKWRIFDLFEEYFVFDKRGPAGWEVKLRSLASFQAWEREYDKAVKDVRDFQELSLIHI